MTRSLLRHMKNGFSAILVLALSICALEVGLRMHCLFHSHNSTRSLAGLIESSWDRHHQLKPLSSAVLRNPDSAIPVEIKTNSWGLRGPEPVSPKSDQIYRIICLGNEQTLAATVSENDTFCHQLQLNLQQQTQMTIEVINAGIPGQSPLLSYLHTSHSLAALQPDLLILNFDMSDVSDDRQVRKYTQMDASNAPLACTHPKLRQNTSENIITRLDNEFMLFRWGHEQVLGFGNDDQNLDTFDLFDRSKQHAWLRDGSGRWTVHVDQALAPVSHLSQLCQKFQIRFFLATYPAAWQASSQASTGKGVRQRWGIGSDEQIKNREPFEILQKFADQNQIAFCDASKPFNLYPSPETLYQHNSPWFSGTGHQLYAQVIARFVIDHLRNGDAPSPTSTEHNLPQTTDRRLQQNSQR